MTNEQELFIKLTDFTAPDKKRIEDLLLENASASLLGNLFFNRLSGLAYGTLKALDLLGSVNREFRNSLGAAYEQNLQNLFKNYPKIIFIGEQENPFKYLKKSHYSILLSDRETWGLVITESKILGIPCVVTNFDVAHEQIEDGKNGIILDMQNEDYYELVNKMINQYDLLKSNGVLVAIISENALYYQTKLSDNFRDFLREHNGMVEAVPSRSFAESGTTIETVIVKLIREV